MDRRDFLRCSVCVAGAALLDRCLVVSEPLLRKGVVDAAGQIDLGPLSAISQLEKVGSGVVLEASGVAPLLVVHSAANTYAAVSAVCTHLGCIVSYDGKNVVCPCHHSEFSLSDGHVLNPPATAPLAAYGTRIGSGGNLIIETRGGANSRFGAVTGGALTLDMSKFPELAGAGSFFVFTPNGYAGAMIVARIGPLDFVAADGNCTFAPCILGFDASAGLFTCPCHGCSFQLGGEVVSGPATTPLKILPTEFELSAQTLVIAVS